MKKHCSVCCYVIAAIAAIVAVTTLASCEKASIDGLAPKKGENNPNVTLTFTPFSQEPFTRSVACGGSPAAQGAFTRSVAPLSDQLSRLSVAIFRTDGTKVKSINQTVSDTGYGTVSVSLSPGTYKVVAVAHNSTEGNATITSPEKVTFANNKMTDTFSYCGTITVLDGSPIEETIQLQRVVALLRLSVTGTIPAEVARFKFYYTGGSSTLNPETGYGCVNSKQTEYRPAFPVGDGSAAATTFDLYTAPHELNDVLKLVITAQDADNQTLNEWTMENIPVTKNKITTWSGQLFTGGGTGGPTAEGGFSVTIDTDWSGTQSYSW